MLEMSSDNVSKVPNNASLERVRAVLPIPANLQSDLDRLVNIFGATLIVHTKLQNIPVLDLMRPALRIGRREPHMVEKCARTGFGILDHELPAILYPDLRMRP